ncbi:transcriptional adapter 2-alpha isoform X10 [Ranitomeya variabilis]|uniref:transcriptional adapter 2-alpha isoform X10 n=1 Tax=Ranitomeya variabilis TaxID=490064 RepID=UPI00405646B2
MNQITKSSIAACASFHIAIYYVHAQTHPAKEITENFGCSAIRQSCLPFLGHQERWQRIGCRVEEAGLRAGKHRVFTMDRLAPFRGDAFDKPPCRGCSSYLMEPYIKCADCGPPEFLLCLQCFSRGFEYKKHQSYHNYEIMTSDFPVLDPSWTAQEEMALLEAVMDCGFGNWQEVAIQMRTKTKDDCENHYMKHFINNPLFASTLLSMKQAEEDKNAETAVPFQASEDPPRPTFDSLLSRDMAGYMPARADFIEEFDNYAEWDLRDIDFVEDDSEILHVEFDLRREIKRLQEYRTAGITTFQSSKIYDRLKKSREEERLKRNMLSEVLQYIHDGNACQQWLKRQAAIDAGLHQIAPIISSSGRRSAPPLDLTGLPGTEKLNDKEKELCQVVRLVPGAYLEYKSALVSECNKQGSLRLAQARALIKIDVNKTRKIYDFLLQEGYITKPQP